MFSRRSYVWTWTQLVVLFWEVTEHLGLGLVSRCSHWGCAWRATARAAPGPVFCTLIQKMWGATSVNSSTTPFLWQTETEPFPLDADCHSNEKWSCTCMYVYITGSIHTVKLLTNLKWHSTETGWRGCLFLKGDRTDSMLHANINLEGMYTPRTPESSNQKRKNPKFHWDGYLVHICWTNKLGSDPGFSPPHSWPFWTYGFLFSVTT